jgi:hypothetical protein
VVVEAEEKMVVVVAMSPQTVDDDPLFSTIFIAEH